MTEELQTLRDIVTRLEATHAVEVAIEEGKALWSLKP